VIERSSQYRRLFFALSPDDETRAEIGSVVASVNAAEVGQVVSQANLHLTLLYLGVVDVSRQAELVTAASNIKPSRFKLQLDRVGYWQKSKVIWLAPSVLPDELASLVSQLRGKMRELGYDLDDRPFSPHVTLLRHVKRGSVQKSIAPLEWLVAGFSLMVSEASSQGVTYRPLQTWPLN